MASNRRKIKGSELAGVIGEILEEFSGDVLIATRKAVDETADEVVSRTQSAISSKGLILTGRYRGNWDSQEDSTSDRLSYSKTVYNQSPTYRVAHLLQNGHGGPHPAPAYPHITEDAETSQILEQKFREAME